MNDPTEIFSFSFENHQKNVLPRTSSAFSLFILLSSESLKKQIVQDSVKKRSFESFSKEQRVSLNL